MKEKEKDEEKEKETEKGGVAAFRAAVLREVLRRECKTSYKSYVEYVHEGQWKRGKAAEFLCDRVQEFLEKKTDAPYDILIISMPPQHGKSMTITSALPGWYLGKNPKNRVICISYSEEYASVFGRRNREKLSRFGHLFGVSLAITPNTATEFETTEGGSMLSRGVLSGITGRACDLLLIDDPIKNRMEADSKPYRTRLLGEWESSFKTRLSAGGKVILIQTRWHEDDLAGRLIQTEKNVTVINLPCEAEENDPLGRSKGEALCPELGKNQSWLVQFKEPYMTKNGSRAWNALFQGHPTGDSGGILKRSWWRFYDGKVFPDQTIISVDAAFKGELDSDFVAIQVWGKKQGFIYLLDAIKEHLDFPETLRELLRLVNKYPLVSRVLIEDKANGSAIVQMLRHSIPIIVPVNPEGGKVARVNAVSGAIEAGNVFLPRNSVFTGDFIEECCEFPYGRHDDQVDCMSQALNRLIFFAARQETNEISPFGDFNLTANNNNINKNTSNVF